MPQIILEYTDNLLDIVDFSSLFHKLHNIIHEVAGAKIENCKSRIQKLDSYYIGSGDKRNAFIHLELLLLKGRTVEVKKKLGEKILTLLQEFYVQSLLQLNTQITIKIEDVLREFHFKYPT